MTMATSGRKRRIRSLALLLAMAALPLTFYIVRFSYSDSPHHPNWVAPPVSELGVNTGPLLRPRHKFSSYDEYVQLQLKKTGDARLRKLWTSRDWRRKVDVFSAVFSHLVRNNIFNPSGAKALCLGARVGQEVVALKEIGVEDAIGVDLVPAPPLVIKGDIHSHPFPNNTFDLEFSNAFDHALFPSLFVSEIERTLKPGGIAVLHLILNSRGDRYSANDLLSLDPLLALFHNSQLVSVRTVDAFGLDTEIVMRKNLDGSETSTSTSAGLNVGYDKATSKCRPKVGQETMELAEPFIAEEPRKPWITLKRNVNKIRYLSNLTDIGKRSRYVYIDVGARNYASSIGSWFNKLYPKQGHEFDIFAIEADKSFHPAYATKAKHRVTLLPYAAWTRNETLRFYNKDGGMGRIVPASTSSGVDEVDVQGFDFAEWLKATVRESDYVVMKMDVEGTEFQLLPRLLQTGGLCLVDELFLECHYNRWQKSSPNRTSKYQHTYQQCLHLFQALRTNGVLAHQWW